MEGKMELKEFISKKAKRYQEYRDRWNTLYVLVVTIPIIFSWSASLVLELDFLSTWPYTVDLAAILSGISGLVVLIGSQLKAEKKYYACQTARGKTEMLLSRLSRSDVDLNQLQSETEEIYREWGKEFGFSPK